ncbi:hypothetical protein BJ165DRAFT_99254 [Panaeolus papilionaceus]|nr:hypothetical protein BJ165DRAFT_99254 [Panaeolus papilionaceus]
MSQHPYSSYSQHPASQYPAFAGADTGQGSLPGHLQMGGFSGPYPHHHHPQPHHSYPNLSTHEAPSKRSNPYPDLPPLDDEELPRSVIPGRDVEMDSSGQHGSASSGTQPRTGVPSASQPKQPRSSAAVGKATPQGPSATAVPAKRKAGGRATGSTNFTDDDVTHLLELVEKLLPIGGDGWEALTTTFNTWAVSKKRPERDNQSLKNKFDRLVNAAGKKPTGKADRHPALETALRISELIDARAETEVIGGDEEESEGGVEEDEDEDEVEIVEKPRKAVKVEGNQGSKVVKAYQANRPTTEDLQGKARRSGGAAAATQVLGSIGEFFNPSAAAERDGARLMSSFQMMQLNSLQNEKRHLEERLDRLRDEHRREIDRLREAHAREIDSLRERLYQERIRADRLEVQLSRDGISSRRRDDDVYHYRSSSPYEGDLYSYRRHSPRRHSPRRQSPRHQSPRHSYHSPIPSSSTYRIRSPPPRAYSTQRYSSPTPGPSHATSFRATISPAKDTDGKETFIVSQVERVDTA